MVAATDYSALITSEHRDKAKFVAVVELTAAGSVDAQTLLAGLPALYDFESAVGVQLDAVGVWVGFGRYVYVDSTLGTVTLGDDDYRTLLRAKILGNHWDGGMESLQVIVASLFPGGPTLYIVDNQDMSMDIYLIGTLTPLQLALLKGGLLVPKPEGVRINGVLSVSGPLFGFDRDDTGISGFDIGSFATYL